MFLFTQLFTANLKLLYRDRNAFIWNLLIPVIIYVAIALVTTHIHVAQFNYGNFLLPGVIAYVIMQGGIYSLAYWLVDLKSQGVIKRFQVTPIKMPELITSVIASRLVVLLFQIIILSAIGIIFFHTPFNWNIGSIILFIILGGSIFLLIGLLISAAAGSYQAASPLTAAVGLPLMFLGNVFIPLSLFPQFIQTIGNILPLTHLANGLRQAYLYPFNVTMWWHDTSILILWLVGITILTISVLKIEKN